MFPALAMDFAPAQRVITGFSHTGTHSLQDPQSGTDVPRVSPYRLAAHLGSAFLVYTILLWTTLSLAFPQAAVQNAIQAAAVSRLRKWALPLSGLLAITGMSGEIAGPKRREVIQSLQC